MSVTRCEGEDERLGSISGSHPIPCPCPFPIPSVEVLQQKSHADHQRS